MIEQLRKQIESVLAQVRDATGNFREIDRFDAVKSLPAPISASVTALAARASDFRMRVGYEVAAYECLAEIEAVDALVLADETTRDFAAKDVPAARKRLASFVKRYSEPGPDNQKPLWRYLISALSLCDRSKKEAEVHLQRAQSLSSSGKTNEALREYQEIYRLYPNPITAQRIRQLEGQPR
jgi:tetratricopeptide (TPR) repeat protein